MNPLRQSNAPAEVGTKKTVSAHGSKQCRVQRSEQMFEGKKPTNNKQKVVDVVYLTPGGSFKGLWVSHVVVSRRLLDGL